MSDGRPKIFESDLRELTQPESFFTLWKQARAAVRPVRWSYRVTEFGVGLLSFGAVMLSQATASEVGGRVRDVSDKIFGFAGAVLGVVVAAFAIFATLATADGIVFTIKRRAADSTIDLKRFALLFIAAFTPYIAFAAWYGLILLVGWSNGPATAIANAAEAAKPGVAKVLGALCLGGVGFAFARMLLVLGALVANVYGAFMFLARSKAELSEAVEIVSELEMRPAPPAELPPPSSGTTVPVTARVPVKAGEKN